MVYNSIAEATSFLDFWEQVAKSSQDSGAEVHESSRANQQHKLDNQNGDNDVSALARLHQSSNKYITRLLHRSKRAQ
jgi:hypothetical protein